MENKTTLGEARVRVDFNVNNDDTVAQIKVASAQLIDMINAIPEPKDNAAESGEFFRLKFLAMTAIEEGGMWAVKAATK